MNETLITLIISTVFGLLTMYIFVRQRRSKVWGFLLGFLLGPIGLLISIFVPPDRAKMNRKEVVSILSHNKNLSGVNLSHENLTGLDFSGADLTRANLRKTNFRDCNFHLANLQDAYLEDANLQNSNFGGADLRRSYLCGANLKDANLDGANMEEANLEEAIIDIRQLENVFSTAKMIMPNGLVQQANEGAVSSISS